MSPAVAIGLVEQRIAKP